MRKHLTDYACLLLLLLVGNILNAQNKFPDGSVIPAWFNEYKETNIDQLGKQFKITDYDIVNDSTLIQTEKIQAVIDEAAKQGGVVVIPKGIYLSGSLFFKPKTHLHLEEGAVLKGSDDISNFRLLTTRIEGQTVKYFAALVNADKVDGFTVSGKGMIDGNGLRYWKAFWLRRGFNPSCTNMDEMRPRLLYVSNSDHVQISGIKLKNSPFWTTHFYKCNYLKMFDLTITAPAKPVKAPSSDAIDLDVCNHVWIKNCYLSVNDDAIALKGGKGPKAPEDPDNGANYNIIIENNKFGFCHSALTCGSESIHSYNIIFRNNVLDHARKMLQLKMRPDTPQEYEKILIENISGTTNSVLFIKPWNQFFDLKGEKGVKKSYAHDITIKNIDLQCDIFFDVVNSNQYELRDFHFENFKIQAKQGALHKDYIKNLTLKNVSINGKMIK